MLMGFLDEYLRVQDGEDHSFYAQFNKPDKLRHTLLAYAGEKAVGIGALRQFSGDSAEIKRMFVLPEYRGRGIALAILSELESWIRELGFSRCILETGQKQPEAIALYIKAGYRRIPNFGPYIGMENSICMEKEV
jgi:GNAT superfamily N-acetyltransferase